MGMVPLITTAAALDTLYQIKVIRHLFRSETTPSPAQIVAVYVQIPLQWVIPREDHFRGMKLYCTVHIPVRSCGFECAHLVGLAVNMQGVCCDCEEGKASCQGGPWST